MRLILAIISFGVLANAARIQSGRIAGGNEADKYSHPYQVGLILKYQNNTENRFCSGTLVKRNYVLTAAFCADDGKEKVSMFTVVLGAHNILLDEGLRLDTNIVTIHPGYNSKTLQNNLALIKLPGDVEITDFIQTIYLPGYGSISNTFNGEIATASGWGKEADNLTAVIGNLREVQMSVITNTACNLRYQGEIQGSQVCTSGADGKSACPGDEGGPLTLMLKGRKTQIGIYSHGFAISCQAGWPPVFVRLTNYLDWISTTAGISILP